MLHCTYFAPQLYLKKGQFDSQEIFTIQNNNNSSTIHREYSFMLHRSTKRRILRNCYIPMLAEIDIHKKNHLMNYSIFFRLVLSIFYRI